MWPEKEADQAPCWAQTRLSGCCLSPLLPGQVARSRTEDQAAGGGVSSVLLLSFLCKRLAGDQRAPERTFVRSAGVTSLLSSEKHTHFLRSPDPDNLKPSNFKGF